MPSRQANLSAPMPMYVENLNFPICRIVFSG